MSKISNFFKGEKSETLIENKSLKMIKAATGEAVLYVYDEIGFYGIEARDFAAALESLNGQAVCVRISSGGGSVADGLAIYSMLKDYPGQVTTINDSICASIATIIFMAGDVRRAPAFASFMTHKPMASFYGNTDEIPAFVQMLENFNQVIIKAYEDNDDIEEETAARLVSNGDYWFNGAEALEIGFVTDEETDAPQVAASVDLTKFDNVPDWVNNNETTCKTAKVLNKTENLNEDAEMPDEISSNQADIDAAKSEAFAEATKRYNDVLALESAADHQETARELASNEALTVEQIDNILQKLPAKAPAMAAAALSDDLGNLDAASAAEPKAESRVDHFKRINNHK